MNAEFADSLVAEADEAMTRRKALLTAAVAVRTTRTLAAARKVVADWPGPSEIKDQAIALIDNHRERTV